jgi:hypothetical protein
LRPLFAPTVSRRLRPSAGRHRERPDPPEHGAEQAPGQVALGLGVTLSGGVLRAEPRKSRLDDNRMSKSSTGESEMRVYLHSCSMDERLYHPQMNFKAKRGLLSFRVSRGGSHLLKLAAIASENLTPLVVCHNSHYLVEG